jgi:hypothetical protein
VLVRQDKLALGIENEYMRSAAVEYAPVVPFPSNQIFQVRGKRAVGVDGYRHIIRQELIWFPGIAGVFSLPPYPSKHVPQHSL